jgi:hypothetical protein
VSPLSMPDSLQQLIVPLSLISVGMLAWWIYNANVYRAYKRLMEQGIKVQAVITEMNRPVSFLGIKLQRENPKMRYRFLTVDGHEFYSALKEVPYSMQSQEEQGVIPIYYLPEKPTINHMAENLKLHLRGFYLWLFVPLVAWLLLAMPLLASTLIWQ